MHGPDGLDIDPYRVRAAYRCRKQIPGMRDVESDARVITENRLAVARKGECEFVRLSMAVVGKEHSQHPPAGAEAIPQMGKPEPCGPRVFVGGKCQPEFAGGKGRLFQIRNQNCCVVQFADSG